MRVAIVTGASKGIGLSIARRLARDGFVVTGCARNASELSRAFADTPEPARGRLFAEGCDVADEAQVEALFERVATRHGRLDALVNNAGIIELSPLDEMSVESFDRVMAVNVRGVFLCTRAAFRLMKGEGGDIVNISSLAGVRNVEKFPRTASYVASKHAVAGLTEVMAVEGKPHGIRVKAVSPGAVPTELLLAANPGMKATITADDLAAVVAFLLGPEARGLSGSNLEIFSNA